VQKGKSGYDSVRIHWGDSATQRIGVEKGIALATNQRGFWWIAREPSPYQNGVKGRKERFHQEKCGVSASGTGRYEGGGCQFIGDWRTLD